MSGGKVINDLVSLPPPQFPLLGKGGFWTFYFKLRMCEVKYGSKNCCFLKWDDGGGVGVSARMLTLGLGWSPEQKLKYNDWNDIIIMIYM